MTHRSWIAARWLPLAGAAVLAGCAQAGGTPVVVDCWALSDDALYRARAEGMCEHGDALNIELMPPAPPPLPEWRRGEPGSVGSDGDGQP